MSPVFISASLYFLIYIIFVSCLVLTKIVPTNNSNLLTPDSPSKGTFKALFVGFIFIFFFGLRDPNDSQYLVDTFAYTRMFEWVHEGQLPSTMEQISSDGIDLSKEQAFTYIRDILATNNFSVSFWYLIVAFIYIVPVIIFIKRIFPNHVYLAFLFWICSYGFYSGGVNGIRNADAVSLFLWGFALILSNNNPNKLWGLLPCLLAYFFHHSVFILWISLFLSYFIIKNTYGAIIIWFISIFITLLFGNFIAEMAIALDMDDRVAEYVNNGEDTELMTKGFAHTGFRWDFLIFSALPIVWGYYVTEIRAIKDKSYQILLNTYIIANAVWILFMYAAYTNRFAALSWSLYPFVLCYPLLKFKIFESQNSFIGILLIGMLIFTIIFT